MPSQSDAAAGGDAGARRRRVLAAHAELFNEALTDEAERLPKLANVVEALALASDAQPLEPLTPEADHAVGAVRLERVRRRIAVWWASDDPAALAEAALERQVDILIVVQGFPLEMAVDAEWADKLALLDGRDLTLLLEGRWTLGQAVRFKHGEQAAHGRFISLRVAPPPHLPADLKASLPNAHRRVFYGSTEAGSVTMLDDADMESRPGSCGPASSASNMPVTSGARVFMVNLPT